MRALAPTRASHTSPVAPGSGRLPCVERTRTRTSPATMEFDPNTTHILTYIAAAVMYAFIGYMGQRTAFNNVRFSKKRVVRTMLAGVLVGTLAYYEGVVLSFSSYENLAAAIGATAVADELLKAIARPLVLRAFARTSTAPEDFADSVYAHVVGFLDESPEGTSRYLVQRKDNGVAPPGVDPRALERVDDLGELDDLLPDEFIDPDPAPDSSEDADDPHTEGDT